jgi:alkylhydroperoxidase family enzyme
MADMSRERKDLVARILDGPGEASHALRRAAFDNSGLADALRTLIDKVAKHAFKVTDRDIAAARESGLSEDQIFELVVCAAIGQATRQYNAALKALEMAMKGDADAARDPR